ncbi:MAG: indolepyruvate ferredoxin oxidoreductase family protein [Betaproteobacteria bacterium]|nr:indolepyruvate ferredoxin oxidoreductase family protein [Betaproteobacteria bacterium]
MTLAPVSLDDKYRLDHGRFFLTGVQALARLPILQHQRDLAAGLDTSGYVSGYRGSPLGGLDTALHIAEPYLKAHHIAFHPAVNEELAATAIWGSQQLHLFPKPQRDGVFAMWYGKGPGVDRCVDVFKHANYAGTAKHGGVLLIAGDDHGARSSAVAHQSEHVFSACGIPVLAPSGIQEYLDLGLHGWAMSRYCGCWVAMKTTSDTVESSATVEADPQRLQIVLPEDFILPKDGVHIRWPDPQLAAEHRMQEFKIYAAVAYARANKLNHLVFDSRRPRLGIIACGKAYLDLRQALDDLGIDEKLADEIGIRLYKVGMPWPLESEGVRQFAQGLEEIMVVEEKRQIIEYQLKEMLYNWREDVRPRIVGKFDETGEWPKPPHQWLLPPTAELTPAIVARAIAARLRRFFTSEAIEHRLAVLDAKDTALARPRLTPLRTPYFCSGCPHNTSTKVPEGSWALGGVGCHLMAVGMNRHTLTICQMGGEGATWLGMAEASGTPHIFANMGDGTYFHSGLLAIRAAVAQSTNITYKLLYNDAVAMTGGQPVDGPLTVPQLTRQLAAEGVKRIVVLAEDLDHYGAQPDFAPGIELRPREDIDAVMNELRQTPGVTVMVYDQVCAAEKRRRRKRGSFPQATERVFINELVCEGCGDCSTKSNCLSVVPVETEFGRKRIIDQFSCNMDYSCVQGFCPSLVTIEGGRLLRGTPLSVEGAGLPDLPEPTPASLDQPFNLLITGIGGTGVVTIGALLGTAAHLEGKGATVLDMTGLAQKGGAVLSHVRFAREPKALYAARIATGEAHAVIAGDLVVTVGNDALSKMLKGVTRVVANTGQSITGDFVRNPDYALPFGAMQAQIVDAVGEDAADFFDATRLASLLLGHSIGTNMFLLGYAWQKGLVPVSQTAIHRAIELNGVAVPDNQMAFLWGRHAAAHGEAVARLADGLEPELRTHRLALNLDEAIFRRREYLARYQDETYARRYLALVDAVREAEARVAPGRDELTAIVARAAFRLFAYKDEYEVARLFTDPEFAAALEATFSGDYRLHYHFAPPWAGKKGSAKTKKRRLGPWIAPVLKTLAKLRFLRGSALDPFGYTSERRRERALRDRYEADLLGLAANLSPARYDPALALAQCVEGVRGFGHIKRASMEAAEKKREEALAGLAEVRREQQAA